MSELNLALPGNPRYQPKDLKPIFGYDNLYRAVARVEIAAMETLGEIQVIPAEDIALLTDEIKQRLLDIRTTQVDERERATGHDIRAWVQLAQEILPEPLRRWVHVPLTSYDALDTARALQFKEAAAVIQHKTRKVLSVLSTMIEEHADQVQIGRTHGQHALPITFGFFLATIASRLMANERDMDRTARNLRGKISGAVGAYNAQEGLGISKRCGMKSFETRVLSKLGLEAGKISTQIVAPEYLAEYLFSCVKTSAVLAQFGRDCRHLMRSEVDEVSEQFEKGQVGSSTMAHKRNPINFENLEGMYIKSKSEFYKVLDTMISEHQRDLVGSSIARDYPIIVINLCEQLDRLLKPGKTDQRPFLQRIGVNKEACTRNLQANASKVMAEPMYISLQMAGYPGDAHEVVNHQIIPMMGTDPTAQMIDLAWTIPNPDLAQALENIPDETRETLEHPECYVGQAATRAKEIANQIRFYLSTAK
jgi:adenylosuccinate lyase